MNETQMNADDLKFMPPVLFRALRLILWGIAILEGLMVITLLIDDQHPRGLVAYMEQNQIPVVGFAIYVAVCALLITVLPKHDLLRSFWGVGVYGFLVAPYLLFLAFAALYAGAGNMASMTVLVIFGSAFFFAFALLVIMALVAAWVEIVRMRRG